MLPLKAPLTADSGLSRESERKSALPHILKAVPLGRTRAGVARIRGSTSRITRSITRAIRDLSRVRPSWRPAVDHPFGEPGWRVRVEPGGGTNRAYRPPSQALGESWKPQGSQGGSVVCGLAGPPSTREFRGRGGGGGIAAPEGIDEEVEQRALQYAVAGAWLRQPALLRWRAGSVGRSGDPRCSVHHGIPTPMTGILARPHPRIASNSSDGVLRPWRIRPRLGLPERQSVGQGIE